MSGNLSWLVQFIDLAWFNQNFEFSYEKNPCLTVKTWKWGWNGSLSAQTWILPVDVESIELVLLQEGDDAVDENLSTRRRLRHGRELLAALVPAADSQGDFQVLVVDL